MIVQGTKGTLKYYEKRKLVKDFIAIFRDGKLQKIKKFEPLDEVQQGYILPRRFTELEDAGIEQCSDCNDYFPDGLDECEHCSDKFCCECADQHREAISEEYSTGGCRY